CIRTRQTHCPGKLRGDHADTRNPARERFVEREQVIIFLETNAHEFAKLHDPLQKPFGDILCRPAESQKVEGKTTPGQKLEKVEHLFAISQNVMKDGFRTRGTRHACEKPEMAAHAIQLTEDEADFLCPFWNFDLVQLLNGHSHGQLIKSSTLRIDPIRINE